MTAFLKDSSGRTAFDRATGAITLGETVEVISYGRIIRGTVTMLGHYTGKPTQMRRHDTGQLRVITGNCRRVEVQP